MEEKRIEGFSDYAVTPDGEIISYKKWRNNPTGERRVMKQWRDKKGYCVVSIRNDLGAKKNMFVHQAVAKAFIENPNNYKCVNHKDRNVTNNRVSNLEWCTVEQNNRYTFTVGNRMRGNPCALFKSGILIGNYPSEAAAAADAVKLFAADYHHLINYHTYDDIEIVHTQKKKRRMWYAYDVNGMIDSDKCFTYLSERIKTGYGCCLTKSKPLHKAAGVFISDNPDEDIVAFWKEKEITNRDYCKSNSRVWTLFRKADGEMVAVFDGLKAVKEHLMKSGHQDQIRQLIRNKESKEFRLKKD